MQTQTAPRRIETTHTDTGELTHIAERELHDLKFLSGQLQAAKTELAAAKADQHSPDFLLAHCREELRIAQDEFDFEFEALIALQEARANEFAGHHEPTSATGRRCASDAHETARRRLFAVLNQHAPKLPREARLRMLSAYLRRDVASTSDLKARELHDCASDIDAARVVPEMYV